MALHGRLPGRTSATDPEDLGFRCDRQRVCHFGKVISGRSEGSKGMRNEDEVCRSWHAV